MDNTNIIPIQENNGKRAVNARDLWMFLESKQQFGNWMQNRIESYGFIENQDFEVFNNSIKNPLGGRPQKEYALSIDMAKELSMIENNEKGRIARKYFIECEKKAKAQLPSTYLDALKALVKSEEEKQVLALENKQKSEKIEQDAPKVNFANAIVGCKSSCLIGELAKILTQNGYKVGQNRLFEWLRSHGFLGTKGERYNVPNQQYVEQGLFEIKKGVRTLGDGVMMTTCTTKVTTKGQMYFVNKLVHQKDLFALAQ